MMRLVIVLLAALCLAGCTESYFLLNRSTGHIEQYLQPPDGGGYDCAFHLMSNAECMEVLSKDHWDANGNLVTGRYYNSDGTPNFVCIGTKEECANPVAAPLPHAPDALDLGIDPNSGPAAPPIIPNL